MKTVTEPGGQIHEIFCLAITEEVLLRLLTELFENHWKTIVFGSLIQGAVFEIRAPSAPKRISFNDGYLTVDFGIWHFHICIGSHKGSPTNPVDQALAFHRRTAEAEFYRGLDDDGAPTSWGLRLANGKGEQQLTVFLPNPFLTDDDKIAATPDWSRLALWDHLRAKYLKLEPDPRDRIARHFFHG